MSSQILIAVIAALPPTIAAVAALLASRRNGLKSDAIHILVNSNMSHMQQKLMTAVGEIAELKRIIAHLNRTP